VQTWLPEHYVLEYVMGHDYVGFYEREMAMRSRMKYPPVSRMINLLFNGLKEEDVQEAAYYVRVQAETLQGQKSRLYAQIELLGPAPSPISRLKNQYRWQLLIKGIKGVHAFCDDLLATLDLKRMQGVRLQVDVDPMNFI